MLYLPYKFEQDIKKIYFIPLSDIHFGDPLLDVAKLQKYIKWISEQDNNTYIGLNGDIFNIADPDRYGDEDILSPNEQLDNAVECFYPIKDRILGITEGNHDLRMRKKARFDLTYEMAKRLGIEKRYDSVAVMMKMEFGRDVKGRSLKYYLYMTHGYGGGTTAGAKANLMERTSNAYPLCDVYIVSHIHKAINTQDLIIIPSPKKDGFIEMKRSYCSSGAFLSYGGYAERRCYKPVKRGTTRIRLDGTRKDVHLSL